MDLYLIDGRGRLFFETSVCWIDRLCEHSDNCVAALSRYFYKGIKFVHEASLDVFFYFNNEEE